MASLLAGQEFPRRWVLSRGKCPSRGKARDRIGDRIGARRTTFFVQAASEKEAKLLWIKANDLPGHSQVLRICPNGHAALTMNPILEERLHGNVC